MIDLDAIEKKATAFLARWGKTSRMGHAIQSELERSAQDLELVEAVRAAQRETAATRSVLAALTEAFEAVLSEADRPKGGMSAPFHGDFAGALRLPSVLGNMRWWAGEARRVLSGEASAVEHWAKAGKAPGRP